MAHLILKLTACSLAALALTACGDDSGGAGGSGGGAGGGTTTATGGDATTTTATGGEGGDDAGTTTTTTGGNGGEGGSGGAGEGGAGGAGGGEVDCARCSQVLAGEADPPSLCEDSAAIFQALQTCHCVDNCVEECADSVCAANPPPTEACGACINENCGEQIGACAADE